MTKKTVKHDMYALSTLIIVTVFTLLIISNIKNFKDTNKRKQKGYEKDTIDYPTMLRNDGTHVTAKRNAHNR